MLGRAFLVLFLAVSLVSDWAVFYLTGKQDGRREALEGLALKYVASEDQLPSCNRSTIGMKIRTEDGGYPDGLECYFDAWDGGSFKWVQFARH